MFTILDNDAGLYKAGVCCGDVAILAIGFFYGILLGTAAGTALTIMLDTQNDFFIYAAWNVCTRLFRYQ